MNVSLIVQSSFLVLLLLGAVTYLAYSGRLQAFVEFCKQTQLELKRVKWPSRTDLTRNTVSLMVIVVLLSFLPWGIDALFMLLIGVVTGQGG